MSLLGPSATVHVTTDFAVCWVSAGLRRIFSAASGVYEQDPSLPLRI